VGVTLCLPTNTVVIASFGANLSFQDGYCALHYTKIPVGEVAHTNHDTYQVFCLLIAILYHRTGYKSRCLRRRADSTAVGIKQSGVFNKKQNQ
jgi:hypothetical protein